MKHGIDGQLRLAETRLRAHGLTGDAAFRALIDTLTARFEGGSEHPALHDLRFPPGGLDLLGLAYERFFPDLFKGRLGQYFTPPALVQLVLSRLPIGTGTQVVDPTCGSGGFLLEAARRGAVVSGIELDPRLVDLARLNLRMAGLEGQITHGDCLELHPAAEVLVANPPFSVPIENPEILQRYGIERERAVSDAVFLAALESWVQPGGWAGVVVPWTVVANPRMGWIRERLDRSFQRVAGLQLPEGVFRPFGGAQGRAAVLWLQRKPCESQTSHWAQLVDPGYDTTSKRLRWTDSSEVHALVQGVGWSPQRGWLPKSRPAAQTVGSVARAHVGTCVVDETTSLLELGDTAGPLNEPWPRRIQVRGRHQPVKRGEVLVARLRPERSNVTVAPETGVGTPEWIRLECALPYTLSHILRSPTWRESLPSTSGQTRPRIDASAVLESPLRWPGRKLAERLDALSSGLTERRRALGRHLLVIQQAVDAHQASQLDDAALESVLAAVELDLATEDP